MITTPAVVRAPEILPPDLERCSDRPVRLIDHEREIPRLGDDRCAMAGDREAVRCRGLRQFRSSHEATPKANRTAECMGEETSLQEIRL